MRKINVYYATRSPFKTEEVDAILVASMFRNEHGADRPISERFHFIISNVATDEPLEVDLAAMVRHKAVSAYKKILMPCIVEHAGLILESHLDTGFPGGLTQPMMDSLGAEAFVQRMSAAGEKAVARAIVGYCDGMSVHLFSGETRGTISRVPRGDRKFYWDTVFCPVEFGGETYAEVSGDPDRGVVQKMTVSQSLKALRQFLEFRVRKGANSLFTDFDG